MKKKVLFLIHTLGGGGAEKVLVNLANGLDKNNYDVTVMTVIDTGIFKDSLEQDVIYKTMIKIPKQKSKSGSLLGKKSKRKMVCTVLYTWFWRIFPAKIMYQLFIKEKYDVEVAFLEGICAKIISASKSYNSKKMAWIHVDLKNQHKSAKVFKNKKEEQMVYHKFDEIICVSQYVKEQFLDIFDISEEKVFVKYNAIDRAEIIEKSKLIPQNVIVEKETFTFCAVGRLNAQKAFGRLLECHKKLINEGYNIHLWIIGEGTDYENLIRYIVDNGLQKTVFLLGFQTNPYYYMRQADAFVCSSIAEGFSTAATEATILGLPIVTTDCSGMKELLCNGKYGIITENDAEALYKGMKKLLDNKQDFEMYKQQSQKRGLEFSKEEAIYEIEKIL